MIFLMPGEVSPRWGARRSLLMAALVVLLAGRLPAQTPVSPPKNKYTPQQDVELGRKAAADVRKQYPVITDAAIVE